jgi:hypothetical protein
VSWRSLEFGVDELSQRILVVVVKIGRVEFALTRSMIITAIARSSRSMALVSLAKKLGCAHLIPAAQSRHQQADAAGLDQHCRSQLARVTWPSPANRFAAIACLLPGRPRPLSPHRDKRIARIEVDRSTSPRPTNRVIPMILELSTCNAWSLIGTNWPPSCSYPERPVGTQ